MNRQLVCDHAAGPCDGDLAVFQVAQLGLTILALLARRMKAAFRPHLKDVLPPTVDRLGERRPGRESEGARIGLLMYLHLCPHDSRVTVDRAADELDGLAC